MLSDHQYSRNCLPGMLVLALWTGLLVGWDSAYAQLPTLPAPSLFDKEEEEEIITVRVDSLIEVGLSPGRNLLRANTWSPVSITLENLGIEVDGYVEMGFFYRYPTRLDERRYRRSYRCPVSLPKRIKGEDPPIKRYTVPVFFEEGDGELWANLVVAGSGWLTGGTRLELGRTPLSLLEAEDRLVLVASDKPGEHNHLAVSLVGLPRCRVVDTRPDRLPQVWLAYTGADAILLDTRGLLEIPAASVQALMSYVAGGGRLIVCGGSAHAALQQAPWPDIVPVTVTGFDVLGAAPALEERFSGGQPLPGSLPVSVGDANGEEILVAEGDLPLIVRRRHGLGSIYYVAFNLNSSTIRQWIGRRGIARLLFTADRELSALERTPADFEKQTVISLLTDQLLDLPARSVVGAFLIIYLLATVPVNYFFLRRMGRRELVWVTIPLLAAVFSLTIFTYNRLTRLQRMDYSAFTVLETESGSSHARGRTFWSVYSPSRTSLSTWFDNPQILPSEPLSGDREAGIEVEPIEFTWERMLRISHLPIRHQSNRLFASSGVYDLQGSFVSDLVFDGRNTITGSIENRTDLDLRQCYIVGGERGMKLDLLKAGGKREIRVNLEQDLRQSALEGLRNPPEKAERGESSLSVPELAWRLGLPFVTKRKAGLQLVGVSITSPIYPSGGGDISTTLEATLVVVSLPVRLARPGALSTKPFPFVTRRICQSNLVDPPSSTDLPGEIYRGEWVTFALKPVGIDLRHARMDRFRFKVDVTPAGSKGVKAELYNHRAHRWDEFPAINQEAYVDRWEDYLAAQSLEVFLRLSLSEDERASQEHHIQQLSTFFSMTPGGEEAST